MPGEFDKFFESNGFPYYQRGVYAVVWNAAIESARKLVESRYDVCEPWLEPEDVTKILSTK